MSVTFSLTTHFYPRPPRGGRPIKGPDSVRYSIFLSTPSARRATAQCGHGCAVPCNFYPRPPRGGRLPALDTRLPRPEFLSTPSARRATFPYDMTRPTAIEFLSTPSARRATSHGETVSSGPCISIHALREEGDVDFGLAHIQLLGISIHALREEGDSAYSFFTMQRMIFLSTPSARRATRGTSGSCRPARHFYPRPPRGGRLADLPA